MATIKREIEFRCDNDCKQSGCPSHKGVFTFQTTATVFCWSVDGKETWFDYNQLEAFTNILKEVSTFRVDMPSIK